MVLWRSVIAIVVSGFATAALSDPIPDGPGKQTVMLGEQPFVVFTYRPVGCREPSLLLLFHGNGGVPRYRGYARPLADKTCMIVIAPRFDKRRFSGARYQRGGMVANHALRPQGKWTINMVTGLADWAQKETGIRDYYILGHSAGGQFVSRIAAFLPTEAKRIVIANPSTHVMPNVDIGAPYGLGGVYSGEAAQDALRRYLAQPVTIYLGDADIDEDDPDLNKEREAMAQGKTRYERGLNTFEAGKQAAAAKGWAFNWRLVQAPGIGHSGAKMFAAPQATEALRP
jgi:pimeloyl-ACP methyl ester carboxylesterase